jgi:histone acetyltransferase
MSREQLQGLGTLVMNELKATSRKRRVDLLMTYADNLALGYFKKQGFLPSLA